MQRLVPPIVASHAATLQKVEQVFNLLAPVSSSPCLIVFCCSLSRHLDLSQCSFFE
jgi:hypothetical protein